MKDRPGSQLLSGLTLLAAAALSLALVWALAAGRTGVIGAISLLAVSVVLGLMLGGTFNRMSRSSDRAVDPTTAATECPVRERELLSATLESTADGILVVDSHGQTIRANARFAQLWRIPDALLKTRDDAKLLVHVLDQLVDPDAFLDKVRMLYASSDESFDTLHFVDGRVFERYSCPLISEGLLMGRVWSFRDVTESVRATEESRFTQFLVDHAAEPAFWMNREARFIYVNNAACQTLGYSREELLAMSVFDIDPGFPKEAWSTQWEDLRHNGSCTFKTTHRRRDGSLIPTEISANYVEFGGQAFNCAFARNITERLRSEQAQSILLRVSESANQVESLEELLQMVRHQLGTLIDTQNFYVALYDAETGLYSFPFTRDEHAGTEVPPQKLEFSLTDYVRRTGEQLLADEVTCQRLENRGEVKLVGHPSAVWLGVPLRTSSGTMGVMAVQDYANPNAYSRTDADWLMSIADPIARVIERKQAEEHERDLSEQLERAERMESLGVLAGGVAHDLNNMLGPLVGYPELLLMKLPEDSPLRGQVRRIGNSAREAADVVQDLLTLARRGRYNMVPTDLNEIVEAHLDTPGFRELVETRKGVKVTTSLDRNIGRIMGSSSHLSKVVMNLVINAFDAMTDGGELTIATSQSYLEHLFSGYADVDPGHYVLLRVRDTGVGIAAEDIDKIFEPYYSKKKMGASGSGLGLAVVYGVIKDHKGYYDILSTEGEGAEFILYFPVTEISVAQRTKATRDLGGSESVLVVDDDGAQREMASELISSLGYRVATVRNGHEALDYLRSNSADLLLLDMIMEKDFDGLDTYREVVRQHPGQRAIVVSGYSSTDRVTEMIQLGAGGYVKKPYTRSTIARAIREELDRSTISSGATHRPAPSGG